MRRACGLGGVFAIRCSVLLRLWSSVEDRHYQESRYSAARPCCVGERCRWLVKPLSILDLVCACLVVAPSIPFITTIRPVLLPLLCRLLVSILMGLLSFRSLSSPRGALPPTTGMDAFSSLSFKPRQGTTAAATTIAAATATAAAAAATKRKVADISSSQPPAPSLVPWVMVCSKRPRLLQSASSTAVLSAATSTATGNTPSSPNNGSPAAPSDAGSATAGPGTSPPTVMASPPTVMASPAGGASSAGTCVR